MRRGAGREVADSEVIGYSVRGRPLVAHFRGRAEHPRILIVAGQHGDEIEAREAASSCVAHPESLHLDAVRLAILADANPDGAVAGTRRNASAIDLNRDHLLLSTPETIAVHAFVNRWRPDLIIDVHTYRPWRPELLRHGWVFPQEVMIDIPTNPAVVMGSSERIGQDLLEFVTRRMAEASLRTDRYTLLRPSGIVRHSNLDILDARNGLALRYGVPTVLLEGRRSCPDDPRIFAPPDVALRRSIEVVVEWAHVYRPLIRRPPVDTSGTPDHVPVRCHNASWKSSRRRMEMQSAHRGEIHLVDVPGQYLPGVRVTGTVRVPRAYGVPHGCVELLDVLARHEFETDEPARFSTMVRNARRDLDEFVLFPTDQTGGRTLSLFLDPESQFGASRFPELGLSPKYGSVYPIVRVG